MAARLRRAAARDSADPHEWTGLLLALAYPDRIGRARGDGGRYLLANGRGARFGSRKRSPNPSSSWRPNSTAAEREARIFLAAPVATRADLEQHFAAQITEHAEIAWDEREQAVRARRERRLGALVLESAEIRDPDAQAAAEVPRSTGLRKLGLAALCLGRRTCGNGRRAWSLMRDTCGARARALAGLERCGARRDARGVGAAVDRRPHSPRTFCAAGFEQRAALALCPTRKAAILEREAPTHFVVPSGSRIPIDYLDGEVPTLSVRLQEMFGLDDADAWRAADCPCC